MTTEQVVNHTNNFGNMQDTVKFLLADGDIIFPVEDIKTAINMGIKIVYQQTHSEPMDVYTTLEVGTRNYELPDVRYDVGFAIVEAVWIGDTQIGQMPYTVPEDDETAGEPEAFAVLGNTIYLYPAPDDTYTMHTLYRNEVDTLSDQTDIVPMSDVEIQAAIFYACYLLKMKDEEFESSQSFFQAYNGALVAALTQPSGVYSANYARMM